MMVWTEICMLAASLLLAYIYLGYPVMLSVLARLCPKGHLSDPDYLPSVTLIISAHNEVAVIGAKIENALLLDYPPDRLDIVVVSDCSDDGTDDVVCSFAAKGVRLIRSAQRRGKTSALNSAMAAVQSEIVVFSDANAMYDPRAVRFLVRHFADAAVGYVVGHARYQEEQASAAGASEEAYWDFEVMIKECESQLGSVVGGDGAIYAIRRLLYEPMLETDINDFVNPLQIVAKGYRGIFEPQAFCWEQPAGEFSKEFSRKVRIVNRSFSGLLRVPRAADPFRTGRFAWQLLSHKLLRWFSPFVILLFLLFFALDLALYPGGLFDRLLLGGITLFLSLAAGGWLCKRGSRAPALFALPYYFLLVNLASARGVLMRLQGTTISTWTTVRDASSERERPPGGQNAPVLNLMPVLLFLLCCVFAPEHRLPLATFVLLGFLAHAFLFYPVLVWGLGSAAWKKVERDDHYLPPVTLLIVAYNEQSNIEQKILNSLALDYPREKLEILVASDGSTDATDSIVSRYRSRGVTLLSFPKNRGKIAALNDAMKVISSEIVVLSDANVDYDTLAVRKLVRNFSDPRVGAVSGKVMLLNGTVSYRKSENGYYCVEHFIQEHEGMMGTLVGGDGAMYAIRRRLFEAPPSDTILDDMVISMGIARRGYLVLHEKEALGFEVNRLELAGEFRRKVRIIAGGYQCLLRCAVLPRPSQPLLLFCFISHKLLRWTSGIMVLGLVVLLLRLQFLTAAPHPLFGLTLALVLASMLLAALVQLFPALKSFRLPNYSHYFYMLMLASLIGCYLGVTGRQKVAWRGGTT